MSEKIATRMINAEELGALLGVSARTVREYAARGMISRDAAGKYRLPEVLPEFFSSLRDQIIFPRGESGL